MGSGELYPCPVTVLYSKSKETEQQKERRTKFVLKSTK
jgi:hypothetical protein